MLLTESKAQLQHFQSETATAADTVVGAGILACWKTTAKEGWGS